MGIFVTFLQVRIILQASIGQYMRNDVQFVRNPTDEPWGLMLFNFVSANQNRAGLVQRLSIVNEGVFTYVERAIGKI